MATKVEDSLTQIQKYKAMLNSKRNKAGEKPIRKPKKKRLRKTDVETGLETVFDVPGLAVEGDLSKSQSESLKEESFDSINVQSTTALSQGSKQSSELLKINDGERSGELVEQKSTITSPDEKNNSKEKETTGISENDSPAKDEKETKKDKSKSLSIRRKRKSKKKRKETEDQPQSDKNKEAVEEIHEEKYAWKESGSEQDDGSAVPFSSPETNLDESQTRDENVEENKSKEGAERKEKISRAKKFKRWASFTKQKKTTEPDVIEEESFDFEISAKSPKSPNQNTDSLEERATDVQIHDDNSLSPGRKEEAERSGKEETFEQPEDLELSSLPEKQSKRSDSLDESTEKKSGVELSSDKVQKTRNESSEKGNVLESLTASLRREKARIISKGNKDSGKQDVENEGEIACSQKDETMPSLVVGTENNESANEAENELELKEKTTISIVKESKQSIVTPADDVNTELEEIETVKEKQPKKKKRGFLRKISSKSLKTKKGEETRVLKKSDISAPLLITAKDQTGSEVPSSNLEEVSPEKSSKRRKSSLNLKLPKGLIRASSSEYKAIAGAEAEKEIEKDETLTTKDNIQQMEVDVAEREEVDVAEREEVDVPEREEVEIIEREEVEIIEREEVDVAEREEVDVAEREKVDVAEREEVDVAEREEVEIIEREEVFQSIGKVQSSEECIESKADKLEYYRANNTEDEEVYTLCRVLMNDVIKELIDHLAKVDQLASEGINPIEIENNDKIKEEKMVTEDTQSFVVEEVKAVEEDISDSVDKKIVDEKGEQSFVPETEEDEQDNSEYEKIGEIVVNTELKESNEIEIFESVQENSEVEPKQSEDVSAVPDHEPQKLEDMPKPENIQMPDKDEPSQSENMLVKSEDDSKEPKDMQTRHEVLQSEQQNEVSQEKEEKSKPSDWKAVETEGTSKLYDSNEVRSIELSLKTQALLDSYIFIDHSFQLSQNFLNQVKIMDFSAKRKPRCSVM